MYIKPYTLNPYLSRCSTPHCLLSPSSLARSLAFFHPIPSHPIHPLMVVMEASSSSSPSPPPPASDHVDSPSNPMVTPLLTDLYQFTMAYAYWKSKKHLDHAV